MTTDTSHLFTGIEFTYCVNSVLYVSTMHGKLVVKLPTWSSNRKYQCTINMLSCGQTAVVSQTRASSLPSVRQTRVDTSPTQTVYANKVSQTVWQGGSWKYTLHKAGEKLVKGWGVNPNSSYNVSHFVVALLYTRWLGVYFMLGAQFPVQVAWTNSMAVLLSACSVEGLRQGNTQLPTHSPFVRIVHICTSSGDQNRHNWGQLIQVGT